MREAGRRREHRRIAAGVDGRREAVGRRHDVCSLRPGTLHLAALPPLSLYVHMPWCVRKCPYCDFNSHEARGAASDACPSSATSTRCVADLEAALPLVWGRTRAQHLHRRRHAQPVLAGRHRPRCSPTSARACRWRADCEITLEANPGTFERDRFRGYRAAGVNRLSLGVQSFDDAHLQALGRIHDAAQAQRGGRRGARRASPTSTST